MGFLDRLERGLDRGVTSVFSRGRGQIKPLDLAQGLRRECDDQIQVLDRDRTLAPNVFTVYLNSEDYDRFASWIDTLIEELTRLVVEHVERQRYTLVGAVAVHIERDDEVRAGRFETESRTDKNTGTPATSSAASAAPAPSTDPIIDIDGQQYLLSGPVTVIGRGGDSDIILDDSGVSRHHVELRRERTGLVVTDLGSTNGTFLDGERIRTPVSAHDGQRIRIGRTTLTLTLPTPTADEW
ncbi:FhaA domain-containing protein [Devriesea agamarum]|uniref:FhaA domain-containing protein n=1 Tax=Devriesea agamarum TaxID=472569 RepID=UPI00071CFFDD|nr:DUF3662 and FHA domain-containing protein [Devriesea agamarum]